MPFPCSSPRIHPATLSKKYRSWVMATTVPRKSFRVLSNHATDSASRWLVGSSTSRTSGASSSTRASATRRRSPPDRFATRASPGGHRSASVARCTVRSSSHPLAASMAVCSWSILTMRASTSAPSSPISALTFSKSDIMSLMRFTAGMMLSSTVGPSSRAGSCSRWLTMMPGTL
mmetsp:Transcript_16383/g.49106  ORF Transcript_16383/g.49106 Transcript_16383/m.49106 type:complete len:175 (-) Transcript_16383:298-822(-)